jgi:hypothetical protein
MSRTVTNTFTVRDGAGHTATATDQVVVSDPVLSGLPGQVAGKVIVGLATDTYSTRLAELGRPIGADHFFVSSWSVSSFVSGCDTAHGRGCLPFGNMKVGDWGDAAAGSMDAAATQLGQAVAALGYPVRLTFHHEPGNSTPGGTGDNGTGFEWRDMLIRLLPRVKAEAPNAIVGPVDNGYKWSAMGQGWTDSELNQIYTDQLLAVCDVLGADYYDGATTRTNGETAAVKVQRADSWADRRGWARPMDIGEWNFVRPVDCDSMTSTLTARPDRWWLSCCFDSDNNNRASIPTIGGGWNFSHGFDTQWDRRDAFRRTVDHALTSP